VRKNRWQTALIVVALLFLTLVFIVHFEAVEAATTVNGVMYADTTWTKAGSPYDLTGPVGVSKGATLTIEPGVTVNLGVHYIQVNGTLHAVGRDNEQININSDGQTPEGIVFTKTSTVWNEQTGSGCVIENAILSSVNVQISGSPKIAKNSLGGVSIDDGSPTISRNIIGGGILQRSGPGIGPSIISNNVIISDNTITNGIDIDSINSKFTISNNIISASGYVIKIFGAPALISNNTLTGLKDIGIYFSGSEGQISITHNTISGCTTAIYGSGWKYDFAIEGNVIFGNRRDGLNIEQGNASIQENAIFNNRGAGIRLQSGAYSYVIRKNTITNNSVGIDLSTAKSVTAYNNIYSNRQWNLNLSISSDIIAANNWWGATDTQAISQTIYDYKNDFSLGDVVFVPFLTAPNPEAPPIPNIITPTSSPGTTSSPSFTPPPSPTSSTQNPTFSPAASQSNNKGGVSQTEFYTVIAVFSVIVVALSIGMVVLVSKVKKANLAGNKE
jgi:parallel beta-helix repeat protein